MNSAHELIELTNQTAAAINSSTDIRANYRAAGLLIGNTFELARSLSPEHFAGLGETAVNALLDAADSATPFITHTGSDHLFKRRSGETDLAYRYRKAVVDPILRASTEIGSAKFSEMGATDEDIKRVVEVNARAFEAVLSDPSIAGPVRRLVEEDDDYLAGKVKAARRSVKHFPE